MKTIIPDEKFIAKNWEKTLSVVQNLTSCDVKQETRKTSLELMLNELCDKYCFSPASPRKEYHSCFPGGLCFHNLNVMKWCYKLNETLECDYTKNTLATISILHELGKIGTKEKDYYIINESDWHIEKGIYYSVNDELEYMKVSHRSLWLAHEYNIPLTEEEYMAVLLYNNNEDYSAYKYREYKLVQLLRMAYMWSVKTEKEFDVKWIS